MWLGIGNSGKCLSFNAFCLKYPIEERSEAHEGEERERDLSKTNWRVSLCTYCRAVSIGY